MNARERYVFRIAADKAIRAHQAALAPEQSHSPPVDLCRLLYSLIAWAEWHRIDLDEQLRLARSAYAITYGGGPGAR